ncbi:hypothetical protein PIIN_06013 [Serendipita indica DSM 11827]|uniref:Uncharacterized protein n=1 Tax=Serendipita indica (strain DSM 11827) TaxID=1109443 RepID=G4TL84_SERID|nr:hypothetical protein PIIN_06013 [Serendipita indica DSM 11827]
MHFDVFSVLALFYIKVNVSDPIVINEKKKRTWLSLLLMQEHLSRPGCGRLLILATNHNFM